MLGRTAQALTQQRYAAAPVVVVVVTRYAVRRARRPPSGTRYAAGCGRAFVPRQAAVRGGGAALREASRAGSRVLRRAKSVTRSHFFLSGRCDRAPTPSFCMPAVVKHSKNLCEGFSQPLGARGKPSGSVSSASLEAIRHSMSTACECSNDVGCTCLAPLAQYREQLCLSLQLVRVAKSPLLLAGLYPLPSILQKQPSSSALGWLAAEAKFETQSSHSTCLSLAAQ